MSFIILQIPPSWYVIKPCIVALIGFIIGCIFEDNLSKEGVVFGVISTAFAALYIIYVKKTLPIMDGNHWKLMTYNITFSALFLIPAIIFFGEHAVILDSPWIWEAKFWVLQVSTGIFMFLINIAIFLQIKYTSPVTHNICGVLKTIAQTFIATLIFYNEITWMKALGIGLIVIGSFWYSHQKYIEIQQQDKQKEDETNV